MKKITLFLAFILLGSFAFASFPVKTEKSKTILTEQISIETENNTPIETETTQISFYESSEESPAPNSDASWMGIVSFSCAILSWLILWPLAIPAVIFGAMGLNKSLKGLAISGMTLGILAIIIIAAVL